MVLDPSVDQLRVRGQSPLEGAVYYPGAQTQMEHRIPTALMLPDGGRSIALSNHRDEFSISHTFY